MLFDVSEPSPTELLSFKGAGRGCTKLDDYSNKINPATLYS